MYIQRSANKYENILLYLLNSIRFQHVLTYNNSILILIIIINQSVERQMQESQQKRSKFRQQIRKKQINQLFSKVRRLHRQRQINSVFTIDDMSEQQKKQVQIYVVNFIKKCILNYYSKNYIQMMKDITIMKANAHKYREYISNCLNQEIKKNGAKYIDLNKKDVSLSLLQSFHQDFNFQMVQLSQNKIQQEFDYKSNLQLVSSLMQISQLIYYNKFSLQSAIIILKFFWNIINHRLHLPHKQQIPYNKRRNETNQDKIYQQAQMSILKNLCISLCSLLNNPYHSVVKKHLNQLGFSQKLRQIIDFSSDFSKQIHYHLINLVYLYNNHEQNEKTQQSVNGIVIMSTENNYKQKYVMYSIFILKRKYRQVYDVALLTLDQLFQQSPYFIDSIKTSYYQQILQLITDKDRKVNVAALFLINTITFYSQSASDQLIQQNKVLDFIYERLMLQKNMPNTDVHSKKSIEKCSNILCDLLLTKNNKLKKTMFRHYVWQLIFQAMEQNSRLFGAIVVFKYFFFSFGRKQRKQILPSFLQAAGRLPLQNQMLPQIKQIKQTLINVFYHSMQHEEQKQHQHLLRLYQQNNLLKYIQVDEEKIQKI